MDKPSKTFSKAGFYLILLFAFFAPVSPVIAHIAAILAMALWIIEQLIFRNTDWVREEMFVPVVGFIAFTLLAFIVSRISSSGAILPYSGYLAIFYFIVQRFVAFPEKRKMIIWTFIAGVFLTSAVEVIMKFAGAGTESFLIDDSSMRIPFFILIVFSLVLAFYSETEKAKDKLFFGLILFPLVAFAAISFNAQFILILLLLLIIVGIFKDRTALILLAIYLVFLYSGILHLAVDYSPKGLLSLLKSEFADFTGNFTILKDISFFGMTGSVDIVGIDSRMSSFFSKLLLASGPPALLIFAWILVKQFRSDLVKIRKTTYREMRTFHLGIVLIIISFVALSLSGSIFQSSSAVLVFWLVLGMSEI